MRLAAAALLVIYAVVMASAGTRWMPRASWPLRAPRIGIVAWQAAALSVATSAVAAGLILAVPCIRVSTDPAGLRACMALIRDQYATLPGAAAGIAGGMLALGVMGRITWCIVAAMKDARHRRASHDDALTLIGRPAQIPEVRLIDDDRPAVYCVPGRRRRIVLTTGALRCLDSRQLDAVLAHERAHLSERHHLVLTSAAALTRAFPAVRFFEIAARQVSDLVEAAADDAAVRRAHRLTLAGALLAVAAAGAPAGALGAGGTTAAQRIQRLIDPPQPPRRIRRTITSAASITASALLFAVPVLTLAIMTRCPQGHYVVNW
jgi:Zn-dependent protease with chaperone function